VTSTVPIPLARSGAPSRTSRPPVVLHVAQPTDGGVARCVTALAASQLRSGWQVVVACPPGGWSSADLRAAGVEVVPWPARRSPGAGLAGEVRALAGVVASVDPAVLHLHSSKAGLAGRLAVRGRRLTVFQPHAWSVEAVPAGLRGATRAVERAAARWTDLILCVARQERDRGRALGIPGRYAVVPNGVDTRHFATADPGQRVRSRARLGLGPGPLAVCVGRLCRQKGQDLLLAAWPRVGSAQPDATLALVGGGARFPAPVPGVLVAGPVTDPRDWYAAADVVVCPSRWEGMALVPLEAMATARSVVASDVGGTREALAPGAGALVPSGDPATLAAEILRRLADPARADAEGRVGRAHMVRHHQPAQALADVDRLYRDLLEGRLAGGDGRRNQRLEGGPAGGLGRTDVEASA
jgi:glycosyltransferase involved in cell wall biosynthesis